MKWYDARPDPEPTLGFGISTVRHRGSFLIERQPRWSAMPADQSAEIGALDVIEEREG
jgi:hypothetical protein